MRGRNWKALALATVAATALAACGGDTGDGDAGTADQQPAQQPAAGQQQGGMDQQQADVNLPEGVTMAQYNQGNQLFSGQGGCYACHGPQAMGTQLAPNLTDAEWINIDNPSMETVTQLIRNGVAEPVEHPAPMPPMGGANLTDEQVQALSAYVLGIAG